MKNQLKFLALALGTVFSLTLSPKVFAADPEVTCWGFLHNPKTNEVFRTQLKQASYDPMWFEGKLQHYGLGADHSYLPDQGIGLIIYDYTTDRATSVTTGFRRIGKSNSYEADLKLYDRTPAGEQIIVGVHCGYTEAGRITLN